MVLTVEYDAVVLYPAEKKLVDEVRNNETLIVIGETGSGKTTRRCPLSGSLLAARN